MTQLVANSLLPRESVPSRMAPLIHKWFARRRPEAIRAVLEGLEQREDQHRLRVLDPFAGSGMILLESLLQGHDVFGVDINPVAWLIAHQTLHPPDVEEVQRAFNTIDESVGPRIRRMFNTLTPRGTEAQLVTAFYVRVIQVDDNSEVELHHNYLIARNRKKNWAVYYCPSCSEVFSAQCSDSVTCGECQSKFDWRIGTVSRGQMILDGAKYRVSDLYRSEAGDPQFKLIAIESFSPEAGRLFHGPSDIDNMNVEEAREENLHHPLVRELSGTQIPVDRRDPRPVSHGFTHYSQLFTPRQLLSLSLLADAIREIEDPDIRYTMALALSDTAGNNNRMCRYAADWLKLTPAFGLHGFHVVTRPVEGNLWGAERGRGSFRNCVKKALSAYATIRAAINELEIGREQRSIRQVNCLPAQDVSELGWESMDAVVTDPPYTVSA